MKLDLSREELEMLVNLANNSIEQIETELDDMDEDSDDYKEAAEYHDSACDLVAKLLAAMR